MYCKNCKENGGFRGEETLFQKTGRQRHHAYEWECQNCGHTFFYG